MIPPPPPAHGRYSDEDVPTARDGGAVWRAIRLPCCQLQTLFSCLLINVMSEVTSNVEPNNTRSCKSASGCASLDTSDTGKISRLRMGPTYSRIRTFDYQCGHFSLIWCRFRPLHQTRPVRKKAGYVSTSAYLAISCGEMTTTSAAPDIH